MNERIRRFVEAGEGPFAALALDLFRSQVARNPTYRALADGVDPARVEDIPAVPVALFQSLDLTSFPVEEATMVFRTSGTTGAVRGVHRLRDTTLYDLGAWRHFAKSASALPELLRAGRVVSLCPDDSDSSLGHMVGRFAARLGGAPLALFRDGRVVPDAWERLEEASRGGPVFLAATAFALDALFASPGRAALRPDSLVMVTGGFKGRAVRLDADSLYAAIPERLGAPHVIGEYGMTELSSQLWTAPVPAGERPGAFVAPPWLRVYTVDPMTGEPVEGEGLLRFVDLCNVDSVLAIETMDLGIVTASAAGDAVTLRGRLVGAEARGCSMRAEEFLAAVKRPSHERSGE
ncbi:MAG: AMP-binding protein [Pseudomonadota bacterium]|nr:AMP-binding protein [Pseudomonadota bacterium]